MSNKENITKLTGDHMSYLPDMEIITSGIQERVISARDSYDSTLYNERAVLLALEKDNIEEEDFKALLSPAAEPFLEEIARKAQAVTRRYFGSSISLFTPLYISNYCENYCIYCGFNCHNNIARAKLTIDEIEVEMKNIAATGLEELLILTGESRKMSDLYYIGEACKLARKYFNVVGLEIYPLNTDEYSYLKNCGADYITVFQETYNSDRYSQLHLGGHKRIFPYRFNAQERALMGGMRGVGLAALLGLDDFRKDAFATGLHAHLLQRKYPPAEISISCPRLRPIKNDESINPKDVHEKQLLQVICAYRLFLPYANITISSRENEIFRDNIMKIAATKISAGVNTGIGKHGQEEKSHVGDEQFEIADPRSVDDILTAIKKAGLQPIMSDYVDPDYENFL